MHILINILEPGLGVVPAENASVSNDHTLNTVSFLNSWND